MAVPNKALVRKSLEKGFTKALEAQLPLASAHVARLRRVDPAASPRDLARKVSRQFLGMVTTTGAAAGAAGAVPGVGIPSALGDVVAFTEAATFYVLSLAEIHGLHPEDLERRRLLVQTVLIGDGALSALGKGADKVGKHWANQIVRGIPMDAINKANKILGPRFITKYGTKQGTLVLSKQVPLGISTVLGAGANHLVGRGVVTTAKKIFGPAPECWPDDIEVLEAEIVEPQH
jgi:hypothetical protein